MFVFQFFVNIALMRSTTIRPSLELITYMRTLVVKRVFRNTVINLLRLIVAKINKALKFQADGYKCACVQLSSFMI